MTETYLMSKALSFVNFQIGAATGKLKRFIIEPFIAHKQVSLIMIVIPTVTTSVSLYSTTKK